MLEPTRSSKTLTVGDVDYTITNDAQILTVSDLALDNHVSLNFTGWYASCSEEDLNASVVRPAIESLRRTAAAMNGNSVTEAK